RAHGATPLSRATASTRSQAAATRRQARRPSTAPASSAANANVHASRLVASNVMPANVMVVPSAALTPRCVVISITSTAAPPTSPRPPNTARAPAQQGARPPRPPYRAVHHKKSGQAAGGIHNGGNEHQPEIELPHLSDIAQHVLQVGHQHRAQNRPDEVTGAA